MMDRYVYMLSAFGTPFYVGVGSGRRMRDHELDVRKLLAHGATPKGRKQRFIAHCLDLGIKIEATKLHDNLSLNQACYRERELITWYGRRDLGTGILLNEREGGGGCAGEAPKARARRAESIRLYFSNNEARVRLGAAVREAMAMMSSEDKAHMRNAHLGQKASPEACAKRRAAMIAYWAKPNGRVKGEELRKYLAAPGSREKIAAKNRERFADPVARKATAEACRLGIAKVTRIKENYSEGARRGWETRRANLAGAC